MKVYMTKDIYSLPLAVAETPRELAEMTGIAPNSVRTMICKNYPGWEKVEIPDDEEEEQSRQ